MGDEMKVKVFSTPSCPHCARAKQFLRTHDIEFQDIDVSQDRKAAQEMIEKSGQKGVPVIEIGDQIVVGFNQGKIAELLNL